MLYELFILAVVCCLSNRILYFLARYFGALCFNFSIGGVVMLVNKPKWAEKKSSFPYHFFAYMLIFVQGPLSFTADYMNMTNDSIHHVLDRFLACPLTFLELCKIITMYQHLHTSTFLLYFVAFVFALFSFARSQLAQSRYDSHGFLVWHSLWHMYPIVATAISFYDKHTHLDATDTLMVEKKEETKKNVLLSDVVMQSVKAKSNNELTYLFSHWILKYKSS